MALLRPLLQGLHALLWLVGFLAVLAILALCAAAYGIPGAWLQGFVDDAIPADFGRLTVERVAFRPGGGLVLMDAAFRDPGGKVLGSFSRGAFGLRLMGGGPFAERLRDATVDDLYVAQIEYGEEETPSADAGGEEKPFPDLSGVPVPQFRNVRLTLNRPDILEIKALRLTGNLTGEGGTLRFRDLRAEVEGDARQHIDADVVVDIHDAKVSATIRGFLMQTRLNGLWRAIDFPIIEEYSNNFALKAPAWGDCAFTVGFDPARDLFDLRIDLVSAEGGTYLGVPFDEAQCTIRTSGMWDSVTDIAPLVIRRGGDIAAIAALRFHIPSDRFVFRVESKALSPAECFRIIDAPSVTEAIPALACAAPPFLTLAGSLPLYAETTPASVNLQGYVEAPAGCTIGPVPLASASATLAMTNGVFALRGLRATLPQGGKVSGEVSFAIPASGDYADCSAAVRLDEASLGDLLTPFGLDSLTNSVATGFIDLRARTDETFPESIHAEYDVTLSGNLFRLPLFAGLTNLLAEHIPGVSAITDSSVARLVGTADAGVFDIPDFRLDGDLLAIEGPARYDLPADALAAQVTAGNFKRDSVMGTLTRWATVPVNRFLWRVNVSGPIANPAWKITTFVGRFLDKALGED